MLIKNSDEPIFGEPVLDEPIFTGRKGIVYDWQKLLLPTETVFEASLHTLLNAGKDDSAPRYA